MVECSDVGPPDARVRVDDDAGHENHAVSLEEVGVFEKGVVHDLPNGGADGMMAKNFLESGSEDWADGSESRDIDHSKLGTRRSLVFGHRVSNFPPAVVQNSRVRVDVVEHPSDGTYGAG